MRVFVTMKHWTLFLLLISPPIVATLLGKNEKEIEQMGAIANLIGIGVFFCWIWNVAHSLADKVSDTKLSYFRICFIVSMLGFSSYNVIVLVSGIPAFEYLRAFQLLIFAFLVYCLYTAAKLLKTWESGSSPKLLDNLGYFFLFLIFPIGVWVLQPKVNKSV
ncbi:MAG TPA: hypothetical protein VIU12_01550 [Chryseolinea sp.]